MHVSDFFESGPFSYGAKKPLKGSVADLKAKKRKEQNRNNKPIEPKDQMVGIAKVGKDNDHGSPYDRGGADYHYRRGHNPHKMVDGEHVKLTDPKEIEDYKRGYKDAEKGGGGKIYEDADNIDTDQVLEYLSDAYYFMSDNKRMYSESLWGDIEHVYQYLRKSLMQADQADFLETYSSMMSEHPDAAVELVDEMFRTAGLDDQATFEDFLDKVKQGVTEDEVSDFLAKGGKITHLPPKKPRKSERLGYSRHIGGPGDPAKSRHKGISAKTQGRPVIGQYKGVAEGQALPYLLNDRGNLVGRYSTIEKALASARRIFKQKAAYGPTAQWGEPENLKIYQGVKWSADGQYPADALVAEFGAAHQPIFVKQPGVAEGVLMEDPVTAFASKAHDEWRQGWIKQNGGKSVPRVKKNSDGTEGDINVPFEKLHPDWQKENLAAGRAARQAVKQHPNDLDAAAEFIHNEWMKRNPKADYNAAQHVPYEQLPELEKEKDRVHVRTMMNLMGKEPQQDVAEAGNGVDPAAGLKKKYPDTKEGVLQYMQYGYNKSFLKQLDLPTCKIHPDPSVEGVWAVDSMASGYRCIIYLAGYRDPWGQIREMNDNEEGSLPVSKMKSMIDMETLTPKMIKRWESLGSIEPETAEKLIQYHKKMFGEGVVEATNWAKEKALANRERARQEKAAAQAQARLNRPPRKAPEPKIPTALVAAWIEDATGRAFPDVDPITYLIPKFAREGITDPEERSQLLDRAARKFLFAKDYYDYLANQWDTHDASNNPWRESVAEDLDLDQQAMIVADRLTSDKNLTKLSAIAHDSTIYRALDRYFSKHNIPELIYNRVAAIVFKKLDDYGRRLTTDPRIQEQDVAEGDDQINPVAASMKASPGAAAQAKGIVQQQADSNVISQAKILGTAPDASVEEDLDVAAMHVGDPVIITGNVKYKGATGEFVDASPSGQFVVVNLYNHGKHAFQASDVAYNDYADSDEEEADLTEEVAGDTVIVVSGDHEGVVGKIVGFHLDHYEIEPEDDPENHIYPHEDDVKLLSTTDDEPDEESTPLSESKLYYAVSATKDSELRKNFGMKKDAKGWYLSESAGKRLHMQAFRAFGGPKVIRG